MTRTITTSRFQNLLRSLEKNEIQQVIISNLEHGNLSLRMLEELLQSSSEVDSLELDVILSNAQFHLLGSWLAGGSCNLRYLGLSYCGQSILSFFRSLSSTNLRMRLQEVRLDLNQNGILPTVNDQRVVQQCFSTIPFVKLTIVIHTDHEPARDEQQDDRMLVLIDCIVQGLKQNAHPTQLKIFDANNTRKQLWMDGMCRLIVKRNATLQRIRKNWSQLEHHPQLWSPILANTTDLDASYLLCRNLVLLQN